MGIMLDGRDQPSLMESSSRLAIVKVSDVQLKAPPGGAATGWLRFPLPARRDVMTDGPPSEPRGRHFSTRNLDLGFTFWAAAWRIALGVFVVREFLFYWKSLRFPIEMPARLTRLFFKAPESLFVATVSGLGASLVLWGFVKVLTEPRIRRWLEPRGENSFAMPYAFRLAPGERTEAEWPGRRWVGGRSWRAGLLVLTNQRLWFFPHAWDDEPWSVDRQRLSEFLGQLPPPRLSWGYVTGLPNRLAFRRGYAAETFVLLDPDAVIRAVHGVESPFDQPRSNIREGAFS